MDLLAAIEKIPAYRFLLSRLQEGLDTIDTVQGLGLPRAARLPLVTRLHQDLHKPLLLISNRADRALALYEELQYRIIITVRVFFMNLPTITLIARIQL